MLAAAWHWRQMNVLGRVVQEEPACRMVLGVGAASQTFCLTSCTYLHGVQMVSLASGMS